MMGRMRKMSETILAQLKQIEAKQNTNKHHFFCREDAFRKKYCTMLLFYLLQESRSILQEPELERFLKNGFCFENDEIMELIQTAKAYSKEEEQDIAFLREQSERNYFLFDLQFLLQYCHIENKKEQMAHLLEKIQTQLEITAQEKKEFEQEQLGRKEFSYYDPKKRKYFQIRQADLEKEQVIVNPSKIEETLYIKSGCTLQILSTTVEISGKIILDGGTLTIEKSRLKKMGSETEAMIFIKNFSKIIIKESQIDCNEKGSFLVQQNGDLILENSSISGTRKNSAIYFWGGTFQIQQVLFENCFSTKSGGAIWIAHGIGTISKCRFQRCQAERGGAIWAVETTKIKGCQFQNCIALEFGSAIFYEGTIQNQLQDCTYAGCLDHQGVVVQHLFGESEKKVTQEWTISYTTLLDQPIRIEKTGKLILSYTTIYIRKAIICEGNLELLHANLICFDLLERDMIRLENASCSVWHCQFDGKQIAGIFHVNHSKLKICDSLLQNTKNGRAIYHAFQMELKNTVFSACMGGAIYCSASKIENCMFFDCREEHGAAILLYGKGSMIKHCKFVNCVAIYHGGAIDKTTGNTVKSCEMIRCKPEES